MAAIPDQSRERHEEALAALLLLGRRYDLPAMIRAARVRPRPFRQIVPTEALRRDMAAPYLALTNAWAAELPALAAAYQLALARNDSSVITREVAAIARRLDRTANAQARRFAFILAQLERWHRGQWNGRIRSATGLDMSMMTAPAEVRSDAANAATWNEQLIADVHRQAEHAVSAAFLAAFAVAAPAGVARRDASAVIAKARKRGLRIGVDQVDRNSRAFDRARRTAAGLGRFRWHHTPQLRPRADHEARDGRIYNQTNAPNDRAGALPFCKCWEEPLWD